MGQYARHRRAQSQTLAAPAHGPADHRAIDCGAGRSRRPVRNGAGPRREILLRRARGGGGLLCAQARDWLAVERRRQADVTAAAAFTTNADANPNRAGNKDWGRNNSRAAARSKPARPPARSPHWARSPADAPRLGSWLDAEHGRSYRARSGW